MDTERHPCSGAFRRAPALHPATPFEKGVDPKTFLRMGNTLFMERHRIRNAGTMDFREPIYGLLSPSPLWVFCALVHGGRHLPKALGFSEDASRLHDLKRPSLFRRDKVPARNTYRQSGFAFTPRKKFLRVPRGAFSKTPLGRVWDRVPQKEGKPPIGVRLFRRDEVPARNTNRQSGFAFTHRKKFLRVPRGVFSKTLLGRVWDGVLQREGKSDRQTGEKA